jgi:hypothetical protein
MKDYTMNKMKELAEAIIVEGIQQEDYHDEDLKGRMREFQPLEFISYFLLNGDIYCNNYFFLYDLSYWLKLEYSDWKKLLVNVSSSNKSVGIYSFVVITYKFLKIDFIPYFITLEVGNQNNKKLLLKNFFKSPYLLQHDDEVDELMDLYSLDRESLTQIRTKLLSQGAKEAQRIEPRKELGFGLGHTTIKPPSSWHRWEKYIMN